MPELIQEYCLRCRAVTLVLAYSFVGGTAWKCSHCGTTVDRMFDDDERYEEPPNDTDQS